MHTPKKILLVYLIVLNLVLAPLLPLFNTAQADTMPPHDHSHHDHGNALNADEDAADEDATRNHDSHLHDDQTDTEPVYMDGYKRLEDLLVTTEDSADEHADHGGHAHEASPMEERFRQSVEEKTGYEIASHEKTEGPQLNADMAEHEDVRMAAQSCPTDAPVKVYDVVAMRVTIVLNRWGDRDPEGYMFALRDEVPRIAAQQDLINTADPGTNYGLSLGLGADAIQPLTLRANLGDCVRITLTNELDEPASFHAHGADMILAATGEPALSTNPDAIPLPGETVDYVWFIDPDYYVEQSHYAHSHGPQMRYQVSHGLFGTVIVEQTGSEYFDPRSGESLCEATDDGVEACRNSWDAMISPGDGSADFREFAIFYHEIGDDGFLPVDAEGDPNPFLDPIVGSYQPNGRALNYRSESFYRRMGEAEALALFLDVGPDTLLDKIDSELAYDFQSGFSQDFWGDLKQGLIGELKGFADESQAYGSHAFGDPATPIPQSYLGDPVKFRLLHGGSETFHVPHLHGGGIQWQRQSDVGKADDPSYTPIDAGLKKHFASRMPSSGNDSQSMGPSETYDLEIACGSGGCQQTVGDFLFHCHVATHYISGMWHFWRVYNTLQVGTGKTDRLSDLAELPDRQGNVEPAVDSLELVGQEVHFAGRTIQVDKDNLAALVEVQLPPQGIPNTMQDATVLNWDAADHLYLNEPETLHSWPNYTPETPGERPALKFDPQTGKLAYPTLQPHLGKRPPFAPNHGPAPYLEPLDHDRGEPAAPGANGDDSLCPAGAPRRLYKLHAIQTDIPVIDEVTDQKGMIFVVKENEELARTDPEYKVPLAIRANQGDCVDIILVNELENTGELAGLGKTNIHIHFVQFDTQASDGVISGASFEQSPRPFHDPDMSFVIKKAVAAGATQVRVNDTSRLQIGAMVAVGIDQQTAIFETAEIADIKHEGNIVVFKEPLKNPHQVGERITVEFVRYRWYVARQNGAIYFHDHVDALKRWVHGLFGGLIAEPTDATYHHPVTGEETLSGPVMDIHTDREVVPGLDGSFREFVLFMADRTRTAAGPGERRRVGGTINLRASPLKTGTARGDGPPNLMFSSVLHGDPETPLLRTYAGDPVMFRLLTTATEEVHPFHITGHHFRWERFQEESPPLTVFGVGISERFNAYVEAAGGDAEQAGDYLYYNGTHRHFREGAWGILRVHDTLQGDLQPLPGHTPPLADGNFPHPSFPSLTVTGEPPPRAAAPGNPCPPDARQVSFDISAINHPELLNNDAMVSSAVDRRGRMYVLDDDVDAVLSGAKAAEPLVIRANTGDCITVKLTNRLTNRHASFHVDSPTFDAQGSLGITLGFNPDQTVVPGGTMTYRYYAARDLGDDLGVVLIRDFGDALRNGPRGLYGALVIEPEGSTYHDPYTGTPLTSGVAAVIQHPDQPDFREFVTVFHDADPEIGTFNMPYDAAVDKMTLVNYRAEPLAHRLQKLMPVDTAHVTYDTGEVVNADAVESVYYVPGSGAGYQQPPAFYVKQQIDDLETARGLFRED